jgi:hypothetical protein
MRRLFVSVLAVIAIAAPAAAQRSRVVVVVPGQLTQVLSDTMGTPYDVPFPPALAYKALLAVYAELKIPSEVKDSAAGQVATQMFYRQGTLGGRQISTYLSCGDGMTGPNADYYRVYMNIWSTLAPAPAASGGGLILRTAYLAGAVNVSEGARQPMPCESTGRLEVRIHQMLLKKLALGQ